MKNDKKNNKMPKSGDLGVAIYAGLDVDGIVKLFFIVDGKPVKIKHQDWIKIKKLYNTEAGEMLIVELKRG